MEEKGKQKYNGWTNYETWTVSLWIDNEAASYRYWRAEALHHRQVASNIDEAIYGLATSLRDEVTECAPTSEPGLYTDLLNSALSQVNWSEIASSWLEDL